MKNKENEVSIKSIFVDLHEVTKDDSEFDSMDYKIDYDPENVYMITFFDSPRDFCKKFSDTKLSYIKKVTDMVMEKYSGQCACVSNIAGAASFTYTIIK